MYKFTFFVCIFYCLGPIYAIQTAFFQSIFPTVDGCMHIVCPMAIVGSALLPILYLICFVFDFYNNGVILLMQLEILTNTSKGQYIHLFVII